MSAQLPQLRKIITEKYIYSVVGLEASNFIPEVSLEGSKNNFSCFFVFCFCLLQRRRVIFHYWRDGPCHVRPSSSAFGGLIFLPEVPPGLGLLE